MFLKKLGTSTSPTTLTFTSTDGLRCGFRILRPGVAVTFSVQDQDIHILTFQKPVRISSWRGDGWREGRSGEKKIGGWAPHLVNGLYNPPPQFLSSWWVETTHLKHIGQIGSFSQVGVKIKNHWNHQPVMSSLGHLDGEQPYLGDLITMVINRWLTGIIFQVKESSVAEGRTRWWLFLCAFCMENITWEVDLQHFTAIPSIKHIFLIFGWDKNQQHKTNWKHAFCPKRKKKHCLRTIFQVNSLFSLTESIHPKTHTFRYTGCLIGIIVVVYYDLHTIG